MDITWSMTITAVFDYMIEYDIDHSLVPQRCQVSTAARSK